ncbi:hypothetical protein JCM10207_007868 [Rhodosporidiobolus poonsookiae]
MFLSITSALGLSGPSAAASARNSATNIVAEPDTTHVAFPALDSQQRAKIASTAGNSSLAPPPAFALSPPRADGADDGEDEVDLPDLAVDGRGPKGAGTMTNSAAAGALAPPPTTVKVVKAPKGRVRVEKGFSQLDWARVNRSGEVDLRGGVTELRRITPEELATHNTREDCWQAYGGKVYNVGPFLRYHPGGVGEIMRAAGKDVLAHAWVNYDALLENCLVGFLVR